MQAASGRRVVTVIALAFLSLLPALVLAQPLSFEVRTPVDRITIEDFGSGHVVSIADGVHGVVEDPGVPRVPYRLVSVLLPQGVVIDAVDFVPGTERMVQGNVDIALGQDQISEDGVVGKGASHFSRTDGDLVYGRYLNTGYLHGYAIANFAVYPVRVDGDDVIAVDNVTIELTTRVDGGAAAGQRRHRDGFRERVVREVGAMVVNPKALGDYRFDEVKVPAVRGFQPTAYPSLEGSPVDYVIITNDSMAAAYQPFADWKTDKGVPTVIRTTEWIEANYRNGVDLQETIRTFIADAYAKWGITYALLGGDTEQIPPRLGRTLYYSSGRDLPVDMYFGALDGDWNADHDAIFGEALVDDADLYVEVYTGRMPTTSIADVALLTGKVMSYERPNDRSYTNETMFAGEVLFPRPWNGVDPITLNGADNCEFMYLSYFQGVEHEVLRMYQTYWTYPGAVEETRQAALDSLSGGFNHFVHVGHGYRFNMSMADASILNTDADTLSNGDQLFNLYMLNCSASAYTYNCLAEHYLRNPDGGAVTTVGANESAFPSASQNYMSEYYRLLNNEGVDHIGETFHRSRLPRTPLADSGDNIDRWTHYIYTLLADPEMPMWTGPVDTLEVSHTASVGLGTTSITVTVNAEGGSPVDSALVCLSKGTEDYQVGTTDGAGQVTLDFRAESVGEIKVVATGRNHARHEGSITVNAGGGAYVSYAGMTVDDDNTGGTSGNGDGVIDAGETIDFVLDVTNSGTSGSGSVDLVLRSNTGGVTVVDSLAGVGVVGASSTESAGDAVRVAFSSTVADETVAAFDLIVKEGGVETWSDEIKREVHAPELSLVGLRIDDTATGNGDGIVDAGEDFLLFYEIKNFGTGAVDGMFASVLDLDDGFIFTDSTDIYSSIAPLSSAENAVGFSISEPSLAGVHRVRILAIDFYGRAHQDTMEFRAPDPPDSVSIDASFGADRLALTWGFPDSTDVTHYNIYRSSTQGGPYTQANADPITHTMFVDAGLNATSTYFYLVTSVDVSGNESVVSPEFSGSTNPAQQSGFPISIGGATTTSPVIGDIDGDGDKEIVQGAEKVYAWHHDGVEMIDGDFDPQTWGVLTPKGLTFVSPIALARIDGLPGLDIIAASRDSMTVYVLNHVGDDLPGWPQPVENVIRAGLVAGDINGDGVLEVIAIDEKGVLYVWNPDGSEYVDGDSNPVTPGVFKRFPSAGSFHYCTPALADIDGDNSEEIIVGTQADSLYALNGDGSPVTNFPVYIGADISGSPAIGDIDDNGDLEIVVNTAGGAVTAYHHDGTVLWTRFFSNGLFFGPAPALGDVTGDGKLETFIPSADGNLYGIAYTGLDLAGWPVEYSSEFFTQSSPIIIDISGDGVADILLGDESRFIHAWDVGGSAVAGFPVTTKDAMRAVLAADDIDGDGDVDLIAAGWDATVYAWDFPWPHDASTAQWPQFQANAHNNGLVGAVIPTGIGEVTFAFDVVGETLDLSWYLSPRAGYLFDIYRAEAGEAGGFERLAQEQDVDMDGRLRYVDRDVEAGERYVYRVMASGVDGEDDFYETPAVYVPVSRAEMSQNYPNPFNPVTRITYWVPEGGERAVSVMIYDVRGARVRTLVRGEVGSGKHVVSWDGRNDQGQAVGSGVYFYRMVQPNYTATKKMLLLK